MPNSFFRAGCFLFAFLPLGFSAENRITSRIDGSRTIALPSSVHAKVHVANDQGAVSPAERFTGITIFFKLSTAQQSDLDQLLEEQRDPSSASYQRWLSPEEFGDRFGISTGDLNQVTSWLQSQGFSIDDTARGKNWVSFSGTEEQLERAFHTEIHTYVVEGKTHFANATPVVVPSAIGSVISDIHGLNDFRLRPLGVRNLSYSPDYTSSDGSHYLSPDDLVTIFDVPLLYQAGFSGAGQKIVIAGQTAITLSDIQAFRARFNLSAPNLQQVLYGKDPGHVSGDEQEADLDLEWAGAVARDATLIYVYSRSVITSVQYAVNQNLAPVISLSYGGCEAQNSSSLRSLAQQANAQGITWLASSGDTGAAACDASNAKVATSGLAVSFPASIPEVTAVGGTELNEGSGTYWRDYNTVSSGSVLSYIPEIAWNDTARRNELSASGGGASIFYAKPLWQTGTGVPNDGVRDVPDISLPASADHDGYMFYTSGNWGIVGGTSVSTPALAGVLALLNQYLVAKSALATPGLGNINPTLYHLAQTSPSLFHDVTSGNNVVPCTIGTANCTTGSFGYSAGPGYDQVTGLGSIDAYNLVTNWNSLPSSVSTTTSVTANPATFSKSQSSILTATVKPASGSTPPTGTVTFSSGSVSLGTAALSPSGTSGVAALTVNGSSFTIGTNPVTATYGGSNSFSSSNASVLLTVTAPTQYSNVVASASPNPAYQQGNGWTITLTLNETAGVATTLTGFTLNGRSYSSQISQFFGSSAIPAKGKLTTTLTITNASVPSTVVFGFSGADAGGHAWAQSISAVLNGPQTTSH